MFVTYFTIHGLVCLRHALPFMDKKVCGMLYHLWTSKYVACFTIYGLVCL